MKRVFMIFAMAALSLSATTAMAQTAAYKGSLAYFTPQSAIKVTIVVEHEELKRGPYAKFSQQYLGVTTPLSDKSFYRVVSASLEGFNQSEPSSIAILKGESPVGVMADVQGQGGVSSLPTQAKGVAMDGAFLDMGINPIVYSAASSLSSDRTSMREKSVEEMAQDAASTIFTLRKRRFDLITGELGEGAFGAGLGAAIDEMARIESEYVSLFVGKKSTTTKSYEFFIVPQAGQSSYEVCKFSDLDGINDSASESIMLTVTAEGKVTQPPFTEKKASEMGVFYRVADMADCRLTISGELLDVKRLPVYQNGALLEAK